MDIIKRTKTTQDFIRYNFDINLFRNDWKLVLADKTKIICSIKLDLHLEETYFVFLFDDEDTIIKVGKGKIKDNIISLEEHKLEWETKDDKSEHTKGWKKGWKNGKESVLQFLKEMEDLNLDDEYERWANADKYTKVNGEVVERYK